MAVVKWMLITPIAALVAGGRVNALANTSGCRQDGVKRAGLRRSVVIVAPYLIGVIRKVRNSVICADLRRRFGTKAFSGRGEMVREIWKRFVASLLSVRGTAVVYPRPAWHYEIEVLHDRGNSKFQAACMSLSNVHEAETAIALAGSTAADQFRTTRDKSCMQGSRHRNQSSNWTRQPKMFVLASIFTIRHP